MRLVTFLIFSVLTITVLTAPHSALALSFTITPTLFEMTASPGQSFSTAVKVVNDNEFPISVYAETRNFAPSGEYGRGVFLPVYETVTEGTTLAEWMNVPAEQITIAAGQTTSVPVSIAVPQEVAPGGHYAAVMIGTNPPEGEDSLRIKTAQVITSLFFVRISGDVIEKGSIRSFASASNFTETPYMDFSLRFENDGNVHLRPQGEIVITNMWGKERGVIPINHKTHFGNVLPESVREFTFTWEGESVWLDFGRYKAQATLGYGLESKQFVTRTDYFWIIPLQPLLITLLIIMSAGYVFSRLIKAYIRRTLASAGINPDSTIPTRHVSNRQQPITSTDVHIVKDTRRSEEPHEDSGIVSVLETLTTYIGDLLEYSRSNRVVIALVLSGIAILVLLLIFFTVVLTPQRNYEVVVGNPLESVTLTSEDVLNEREEDPNIAENDVQNAPFELILINAGAEPGVTNDLSETLAEAGFVVTKRDVSLDDVRSRTTIVYSPELFDDAVALKDIFGDPLMSPLTTSEQPEITIYIGKEYRQ